MAITSLGYQGSVDEVGWARLAGFLGHDPCVVAADFAVTAVAGADRTVRVPALQAYGHGVLDTITAPVDLQTPLVASGTRWDAVVLRRDWTDPAAPGNTKVQLVTGTSTQRDPATLAVRPGEIHDQVLAWVQVTAGQTAITGLVQRALLYVPGQYRDRSGRMPTRVKFGGTGHADETMPGRFSITQGWLLGVAGWVWGGYDAGEAPYGRPINFPLPAVPQDAPRVGGTGAGGNGDAITGRGMNIGRFHYTRYDGSQYHFVGDIKAAFFYGWTGWLMTSDGNLLTREPALGDQLNVNLSYPTLD